MYVLNKIVGGLVSPIGLAAVMLALAAGCRLAGRRRVAFGLLVAALGSLWLWSTPLMMRVVGCPLEREFLVEGCVPTAESFPAASAIVLLGGSMGGAAGVSPYAEMWASADRVWQAARLWKVQEAGRKKRGEGKEVKIFVTGKGSEETTKGLLVDFGVPTNAMVFVGQARNTEEEAKTIVRMFECSTGGRRPRVLLVTSAWHMKRARLMFEKYVPQLEVVPAPADFEATVRVANTRWFEVLAPKSEALMYNEYFFHEWLGYFGYRWLR